MIVQIITQRLGDVIIDFLKIYGTEELEDIKNIALA